MADANKPPKARAFPPVYFLLALVLAAILHFYSPVATILEPPISYGGILFIAVGMYFSISAARLFSRHKTAIVPFEPSSALVTTGPFRFTRNPMYLGMLLIVLGVGSLLGSASAFFPAPFLALILDRRFVRNEEVMMRNTFGDAFEEYAERVRRWV